MNKRLYVQTIHIYLFTLLQYSHKHHKTQLYTHYVMQMSWEALTLLIHCITETSEPYRVL